MIAKLGGRKFIVAVVGILAVFGLAWGGKDATAFGAIALIVGGFVGGNSYIEGRHAGAKSD